MCCVLPEIDVRADRPFVVALVYDNTIPVFLGHVTDPEANWGPWSSWQIFSFLFSWMTWRVLFFFAPISWIYLHLWLIGLKCTNEIHFSCVLGSILSTGFFLIFLYLVTSVGFWSRYLNTKVSYTRGFSFTFFVMTSLTYGRPISLINEINAFQ